MELGSDSELNGNRKPWRTVQVKVKVTQPCPTLWDPMDYTVCGILQARILEWVAFLFSRGSSQPRDWTQVSCIAGGFFTSWATKSKVIIAAAAKLLQSWSLEGDKEIGHVGRKEKSKVQKKGRTLDLSKVPKEMERCDSKNRWKDLKGRRATT